MSDTYDIEVVNRNARFSCSADQSLLAGMEVRNGKSIAVGCRGGGCGVCKILILKGDYDSQKMSASRVTPEERKQGFALACRVFPRSNMLIETDHFQPRAKTGKDDNDNSR